MNILVTGGAGFIGSNFLNYFVPRYPDDNFINLDKLTYAANPLNVAELNNKANYCFEQADLVDYDRLSLLFAKHRPQLVIHFAAESHVDRSIHGPSEFIQSNIIGTFNLLENCRKYWDLTPEKSSRETASHRSNVFSTAVGNHFCTSSPMKSMVRSASKAISPSKPPMIPAALIPLQKHQATTL